jgi:DNA-binding response OmpR family regulator
MPDIVPLQVILAQGDPDDQQFFLEFFKKSCLHVQVQCLQNGALLMNYLQDEDGSAIPDVFFLDINMPCNSGKDCLREIRSKKKYDKVPVVIMSTSRSKKLIHEMYKEGANLYLNKRTFFKEDVAFLQILFKKYSVPKAPKVSHYYLSFHFDERISSE